MALAGSKGSSQSKTDSTSTTTNIQTTTNNVDNSVTTSDENALLALTDVSSRAFDTARDIAESVTGGAFNALTDIGTDAVNLSRDALGTAERSTTASLDNALLAYGKSLDFSADVVGGAFEGLDRSGERVERFATTALESNTGLANDAFASNLDVTTRALDAVADAGAGLLDFAESLFSTSVAANERLTDQNVAGLTALATQNSATSEDRISKIVIYAIVAIAAAWILPKIIRGGSL